MLGHVTNCYFITKNSEISATSAFSTVFRLTWISSSQHYLTFIVSNKISTFQGLASSKFSFGRFGALTPFPIFNLTKYTRITLWGLFCHFSIGTSKQLILSELHWNGKEVTEVSLGHHQRTINYCLPFLKAKPSLEVSCHKILKVIFGIGAY